MRKLINRQKNATRKVLAAMSVLALSAPAFATVDTAPVNEAKTDMLAVSAAMLGLAVAVWGSLKVVSMFGRR